MRKIIIKISILFIIAMASGCKDYLDLPPKNQRAVASLSDVESVLAGYLDAFTRSNTQPIKGTMPIMTEAQNMMFEAYSDNIDFEANFSQYVNVQNIHADEKFYANKLLYNDFTTMEQIWNNHYEVIGFLNALIDECDELEGENEQEVKRVKGEMLVHRAYYIYKLQQYFAPMDKEDMGIPLYLHTGKEVMGVEMKRRPSSEVYSAIISDLNLALEYIGEAGKKSGFNIFYDKRFINNLLSQVYWFKAASSAKADSDYENAATHAKAAIEGVEMYVPKSLIEFQNIRRNLNPEYPSVYMQSVAFGTVAPIYGSTFDYLGFAPSNLKVSDDLRELFEEDEYRTEAYFNGPALSSAWPDGMANGQKYVRMNLFAPEEAYLVLAESLLHTGQQGQALEVLNTFKAFRGASEKSGLSEKELQQEIINERRKEFFCDTDKRWIDLKRYKIGNIKRTLEFFGKEYTVEVTPGDFHSTLPVPLSEIQENPNIVPHEGWDPIVF